MSVDPLAEQGFGATAEAYQLGRPAWPSQAIADLVERFDATTVLDLAAGTGKLTEVLASTAPEVVAVEPIDAMRRVLESRLPGVRALAGTAEAIPLADASVDAVFVAEAFHWFDVERAPGEIARVLRPGGGLAIMWNVPGWDSVAWLDELDAEVIEPRRREASRIVHRDTVRWREALAADDRFAPLEDLAATNEHHTDRARILAQIRSFSWIGALSPERRAAALAHTEEILDRHGIEEVTVRYRTEITTTRRLDG